MGSKRVITASEIGEYLYCNRAWWYHRIQGIEPGNTEDLSRGDAAHLSHGRTVESGELARKAALVLLTLALLIGIVWVIITLGVGAP